MDFGGHYLASSAYLQIIAYLMYVYFGYTIIFLSMLASLLCPWVPILGYTCSKFQKPCEIYMFKESRQVSPFTRLTKINTKTCQST